MINCSWYWMCLSAIQCRRYHLHTDASLTRVESVTFGIKQQSTVSSNGRRSEHCWTVTGASRFL